ncbi:MAG: penicillin-binding protein 2 [Candidatus Komeilibacteria bacterium]
MMRSLDWGDSGRINKRITILSVVILLFFLAIIARLFWLQVIRHEQYADQGLRQQQTISTVSATRGQIFARDHTNVGGSDLYPLAANKIFYEIFAAPSKVTRPDNSAEALATILDLKKEDLLPRLEKTDDQYELIKHKVPVEQKKQIEALQLPGILSREEIWRYYPDKEIGAQLLGFYGYLNDDKVGKYGLESYWDKQLAGVDWIGSWFKSPAGIAIGGQSGGDKAVNGADLILTIDRTIQYQACKALDRAVKDLGASDGTVIIEETTTGRILALCNSPSFDPNVYNEVQDIGRFNNNVVFDAYEPGSVFKVLAMSVAIDSGKVTPATTYEDKGVVKLAGFEIHNSDRKAHGVVTMTQVLEQSLNTGMIFATENVPNNVFKNYLSNYGFGQKYNLELDQEVSGDISSLSKQGQIHKATASYGQGITVTGLQLVNAVNAIANRGQLMQPYIVEEVKNDKGMVENRQPKVLRQVITSDTASKVTAMMVSVVENGFGKKAGVPGYYIAGKTGTAQVVENGKYSDKTIQTFVGFGPVSSPRFTMVTKLTNPSGAAWAESSATPLFGEIAKFLLNYYQIPPER